jgi:hypothetical protein
MSAEYKIELFRSGLSLIVAFLSLGATWLVGQKLTFYWHLRQKKSELNLATLQEFYAVYGEFKALVKVWRLVKNKKHTARVFPVIEEERWALLKRACALESKGEALVLRASSERILEGGELEVLGLFRQAMQSIRESIRDDVECPFGRRGVEYKLLNHLATGVASMLSPTPPNEPPASEVAASQLAQIVAITSARWMAAISRIKPAAPEASDEDA